MSAVKILPHYTYDDVQHWDNRWELVEGLPFAMSPSPIPRHQYIAGSIFYELMGATKKCKSCDAYLGLDYLLADDTVFIPDVLVVCGKINKKFLDFPPSLVVEVVSPSTALKDRHTKFELYEKQGIKYYLIVSADTEEVEVYVIENGVYELKSKGRDLSHTFTFDNDCEAVIDFKEIW